MLWEYLILGVVLAWALFYIWRTFFKKKGCSCGDCPAAIKEGCAPQGLGDLRQCPEDGHKGENKGELEKGKVGDGESKK